MDRKLLLAALKKVEPAIGTKDAIVVLACLCFGKTAVHAYDDEIAMVWPYGKLAPNFRGAVRGKLLVDWLHTTRSENVEFESADGNLRVKAGRAKLDLPILPPADFIFSEPDTAKAREIIPSDVFMESLAIASMSMSNDPSVPWTLGVTVEYSDNFTRFYSTNDKTITRVALGDDDGGETRSVIFPPKFVSLLLALKKSDPPMKILFTRKWVIATFQSGLKLFTNSVDGCDPSEYRNLLDPVDERDTRLKVPKGMGRAIERSMTVIRYADPQVVKLRTDGEYLRLRTTSSAGEVADTLPFPKHPTVEVIVPPDLLLGKLDKVEKIAVFEDCIRIEAGGMTHVVCTVRE